MNLVILNNTTKYRILSGALDPNFYNLSLHTNTPNSSGSNEVATNPNMYKRLSCNPGYTGTDTNPCYSYVTGTWYFAIPEGTVIKGAGIWDNSGNFHGYMQFANTYDFTAASGEFQFGNWKIFV
jgi:hypothetical protein